eukprot:GSMAST32.ASY1.ANO1.1355.1 assembled CDS
MASLGMEPCKVCVAGGGGFIGSHLAKRLKNDGFYVVCVDWKRNEFMEESEFCNEFQLGDLRTLEACKKATAGCEHVYNMAADMGGMGFILSNQSLLFYNNTMISFNMAEASRFNGVKRFFYCSSACIYPEHIQMTETIGDGGVPLKEADAWPAQPQDAYGLEKLVTEELLMYYEKDFGMKCRIARFHNIYGPHGTWRGGREKVPAAFCRKACVSQETFEMWGDGQQTRSFCPEGVRGRNSDNNKIKKVLGWAPSISVADGLERTYKWINKEVEKLSDAEKSVLMSSKVVTKAAGMKETAELVSIVQQQQ